MSAPDRFSNAQTELPSQFYPTQSDTKIPAGNDVSAARDVRRQVPSWVGERWRKPFLWLGHVLLLAAGGGLWVGSLFRVDEADLSNFGLAAILPVSAYIALAITLVGLVLALHERSASRLPGLYVVGLTTMLHGLPTFVYEHLRFSWAWEQVGIVDFIQRTGTVDPAIAILPEYHIWSGFFGINAVITSVSNLESALSYAAWAPIFFELLFVGALYALFTTLTKDPRLIWASIAFFVVGNWVGQDYFSPQAFAYFLYLVVVGILLRWYVIGEPFATVCAAERQGLPAGSIGRQAVDVVLAFSLLGLAVTHPLAAMVALAAIAVLRLTGALSVTWPFWLMAVFCGAWLLGPARSFVLTNNIFDSGLFDVSQLRASPIARLFSFGIAALAFVGWLNRIRYRLPTRVLVALALMPVGLVLVSSNGAESLLLGYLFSLPLLAFLTASVWFPLDGVSEQGRSRSSLFVVLAVVVGGLLLAGFTADTRGVFSGTEVAAAEFIIEHGHPGALIVEANADYPRFHRNYEQFTYRRLDEADADAVEGLLRDPAAEIAEWFDQSATGGGGYVIITSSQRWSIESLGTFVSPTLDTIERSLLASDRFEVVFDSSDARVFGLVEFR